VYCKPIFGEILPLSHEKFVFVLMPFEDELTEIYNQVIKPVVESKELKCKRADDYKTNKAIMKDIWDAICQSQIVIADMTGLNPNVMYELGIAHTVGKQTIMIIQENASENQKFPFDMAHIRRIEYQNKIKEFSRLKKDLSDTLDFVIKEVEKDAYITDQVQEIRKVGPEETTILRSLFVDKREEKKGLAVYVYAVDLGDNRAVVYVKIENETKEEVHFFTSSCYAKQGKNQFRCVYPFLIRDIIPPGVIEKGSLSFEPIDANGGNVEFHFRFTGDTDIVVEVEVGAEE
jgi:nucleoside 2-deoxyribosyltransferase